MSEKKECEMLPFIGGIVVGALLALVLTPNTGKENREKIKSYAKQVSQNIKKKMGEEKS
ncbi:MAG TPA: YtxH domain-containing protein [Candidatus Hydrothermia bacterium]|nr:YtxH domain-containing protein [Candidatus Hydrothermae bacterium]MDD5573078.1 YtxH domain-containing protein [Candidatus Hydrothermia bacterium]HOK22660.1 YtxH domain-containing protein [Candidatus Hydrothermia bacterium]HOL23369.1 YtxH domain-containing protein [Candidatus Hydrothermia bacterium]HPO78448.1 YtxH domain-containing protein [Candidatus Hydrothermia bacterium]